MINLNGKAIRLRALQVILNMFSGYYVIHKKKFSLFLSLNLIAQMMEHIVVGIFVIHTYPLR